MQRSLFRKIGAGSRAELAARHAWLGGPSVSAVLAAILLSATARADLTEADKRAAAEALFATAQELVAAKDFAAACPKLEEVVRLQPLGVGAKVALSDCYLAVDKLASAHAMLSQAASLAAHSGQTARAADVQREADALKPRLSTLTITVPAVVAATPGLVVLRDGVAVTAPLHGVTVPIDGGTHVVSAKAPHKQPFERRLDIAAEGQALTVEIAPLVDEPTAALPPVPPAGPEPEAEVGWPALRVGGVATGGVGLAIAVVGAAVAGAGVAGTNDAVDAYAAARATGDTPGKQRAAADHDAARTQTVAGWVTAGVGGAALVAGIVMAALPAPEAEAAEAARVHFAPWLDATGAGAAFGATW